MAKLTKSQLSLFYGIFKRGVGKLRLGEMANSAALRNNLEAVGVSAPFGSQTHHIVGAAYEEGRASRDILKKFGIDVNSAMNGVFLPGCGSSGAIGIIHCGKHVREYEQKVHSLLETANSKEEAINILNDIRNVLLSGEWALNAR